MKNLMIALFILLVGSFLSIKTPDNYQDKLNEKAIEENEVVDLNGQSIDFEEDESVASYSTIIEKNVIPLKIFDFFNIL